MKRRDKVHQSPRHQRLRPRDETFRGSRGRRRVFPGFCTVLYSISPLVSPSQLPGARGSVLMYSTVQHSTVNTRCWSTAFASVAGQRFLSLVFAPLRYAHFSRPVPPPPARAWLGWECSVFYSTVQCSVFCARGWALFGGKTWAGGLAGSRVLVVC